MTAFTAESWIWYGVVTIMVALRFTARLLHFKNLFRLQIEDWLMLFIFCLYTILISFLNVDTTVQTNLINPADIPRLTQQEIQQRTYGSKTVLLVEQCMCAVQWGTKACLLILYWRLTQNLTQGLVVKITGVYVAVTYVVMEILYFAVWCRPFHDYWQTPTDNTQCTTALHHLIVNLSFNLSSDLLILSIPLPLLIRTRIEWKRKLLLVFPFSLGFFTIVCAILSKHLSFTQPFSGYWVYWYCRESSTAMIVTNMPYTWSLVRRVFKLRSFFGESNHSQDGTRHSAIALQGLSAREASQVTTSIPSKNRSFKFLPARWKDTHTTSKFNSAGQDSMHAPEPTAHQAWLDAPLSVDEKAVIHHQSYTNPSSTSSGNSVIKVPAPAATGQSTAASAVDKLYCIAWNDLEDEAEDIEKTAHATTQSADSKAIDKLYRLDDLDDDDDADVVSA